MYIEPVKWKMIFTIDDPRVFDALARGEKRYEGRVMKERYERLSAGDYVLFILEGGVELLFARVTEKRTFSTVDEMVRSLWKDLLPFTRSVEEALRFYRKYYNTKLPAIAIGVDPLAHFVLGEREIKKWLGMRLPPVPDEWRRKPLFYALRWLRERDRGNG